jgi:hypothetical protein
MKKALWTASVILELNKNHNLKLHRPQKEYANISKTHPGMFYHDMRTPVPLLPDIRFL